MADFLDAWRVAVHDHQVVYRRDGSLLEVPLAGGISLITVVPTMKGFPMTLQA